MSNFVTALLKQRRDEKKAEPDTNGRLREILAILRKYNYDDGITPEIVVNILQELRTCGADRQPVLCPAPYP